MEFWFLESLTSCWMNRVWKSKIQSRRYNTKSAQGKHFLTSNMIVKIESESAINEYFSGIHDCSNIAHDSEHGRAAFCGASCIGGIKTIENITIDMKVFTLSMSLLIQQEP